MICIGRTNVVSCRWLCENIKNINFLFGNTMIEQLLVGQYCGGQKPCPTDNQIGNSKIDKLLTGSNSDSKYSRCKLLGLRRVVVGIYYAHQILWLQILDICDHYRTYSLQKLKQIRLYKSRSCCGERACQCWDDLVWKISISTHPKLGKVNVVHGLSCPECKHIESKNQKRCAVRARDNIEQERF